MRLRAGENVPSHHQDGALHGLDEEILLAARDVVGTLDTDLETGLDGTGKDTTESVETTLIGRGHHLGDVKHQGTLSVTFTDGNSALIIYRPFVEGFGTVGLRSDGRRKVHDDHLEESIGGGKELLHDDLEERLALKLPLISLKLDVKLLEENFDLVVLESHDGSKELEDGVQDELVESTLELLALVRTNLGPLLGLGVEEVVAPETLHHLHLVNTKLLGVTAGELADGESPSVETGTESDRTLLGVDLDVTERLVEVSRDGNVDGLNGTGEGLVKILLGNLQLEKSAIDLVDDADRLDALGKSLTEYGLGLDTHTRDTVDNDKRTIGDTESGGDLRREINVPGGINQVDQEAVALGGLLDVLEVLIAEGSVQGDGGGLDCDTTVLFILTSIGETSFTGLGGRDNTGTLDEGVRKCGLSVIDYGMGVSDKAIVTCRTDILP